MSQIEYAWPDPGFQDPSSRSDYVLGFWKDELDVEYVRMHESIKTGR